MMSVANDLSGADPSAAGIKRRRGKRERKGLCLQDRPIQHPDAAGIDIGAREIFVAVPAGRDENPVRVFATFTEDLQRMADWLLACRITTVAMESTGSRCTRFSKRAGSNLAWPTRVT